MSDRVAAGVMQEVGPVVDIVRPWLDLLLPALSLSRHGDAARCQYPKDLLLLDITPLVDDQQVDQVVDVGQLRAMEHIHRDRPINSLLLDPGAGSLWAGRGGYAP